MHRTEEGLWLIFQFIICGRGQGRGCQFGTSFENGLEITFIQHSETELLPLSLLRKRSQQRDPQHMMLHLDIRRFHKKETERDTLRLVVYGNCTSVLKWCLCCHAALQCSVSSVLVLVEPESVYGKAERKIIEMMMTFFLCRILNTVGLVCSKISPSMLEPCMETFKYLIAR